MKKVTTQKMEKILTDKTEYWQKPCWVYLFRIGATKFYKFGMTTDLIKRRNNIVNEFDKTGLFTCFYLQFLTGKEFESSAKASVRESEIRAFLVENNVSIYGNDFFRYDGNPLEILKNFYQ